MAGLPVSALRNPSTCFSDGRFDRAAASPSCRAARRGHRFSHRPRAGSSAPRRGAPSGWTWTTAGPPASPGSPRTQALHLLQASAVSFLVFLSRRPRARGLRVRILEHCVVDVATCGPPGLPFLCVCGCRGCVSVSAYLYSRTLGNGRSNRRRHLLSTRGEGSPQGLRSAASCWRERVAAVVTARRTLPLSTVNQPFADQSFQPLAHLFVPPALAPQGSSQYSRGRLGVGIELEQIQQHAIVNRCHTSLSTRRLGLLGILHHSVADPAFPADVDRIHGPSPRRPEAADRQLFAAIEGHDKCRLRRRGPSNRGTRVACSWSCGARL